MAKKGRNLMGGRNPKRSKSIDDAIAGLISESGKAVSDMDRKRLSDLLGESGKTISDADRQRAMDRAGMLEALERKEMGMKYGGKVRAMKNGGAVMNGRGPKFKGQS
jgi:hypothetical protein